MNKRREFLCLSASAVLGFSVAGAARPAGASENALLNERLARLEAASGGRLGAALLETGAGRLVGYRLDESFPICSTFKLLAVAAVLSRVDHGREQLERSVPITWSDIIKYAPVTSQHVGPSGMTVAELCGAAMTLSDNTAANLLLRALGGPPAVTAFARSIGDRHTRLDRTEPALNEATPGDMRDTTTPRVMAHDLNSLVCGPALTPASRALLKEWMVHCKTGDKKIRSALPKGYLVGDKTGSGNHNTSNDIAVIWPANKPPLVLTIYVTGITADSTDAQSAVISEATRELWATEFGA